MQNKKFTSSKIEELKKKKKKIFKIKIIIFSFLVILIFFGLSILSKWEKININNINIEGNKVLNEKDLKSIIEKEINTKYLWLFPKTNSFLVPRNKIEKNLKQTFGRIKTINLKVDNFRNLDLAITEREALYTWCGEILPEIDMRKQEEFCKFVDENGFVFDNAPYFSGDVYFRFYGVLDNNTLKLSQFAQIVDLINNIKEINLTPIALYYKDGGEVEIYLASNKHIKEAPKIIFKIVDDLNLIFDNLNLSINNEPLKTQLQDNYNNLLYINLNFNNKVFYKFN